MRVILSSTPPTRFDRFTRPEQARSTWTDGESRFDGTQRQAVQHFARRNPGRQVVATPPRRDP